MPNETTVDELEIKITAQSNDAAAAIDKLCKSLSGLKDATKTGVEGLEKIVKYLGELTKALGNSTTSYAPLHDLAAAINYIDLAKLRGITEELKNFRKAVNGNYSGAAVLANYINQISQAINGIDEEKMNELYQMAGFMAGRGWVSADGPWQNPMTTMVTTTGGDPTGGGTLGGTPGGGDNIDELKRRLQELEDELRRVQREGGGAGGTTRKLGTDAKGAGNEMSKAAKKIDQFVKSFLNIAKYRMIRAIVKEITAALKEGINNYAMYSDSFNDTMSELKSTYDQMKNAIGAAIIPLIEALEPALEWLMNAVIDLANDLQVMFAVMTGKDTVSLAVKQQEDYRDSIEDTKKSLMGFDEINTLGDQSTDYSTYYEEVAIADMEGVDSWVAVGNALSSIGEVLEKVVDLFMKFDSWIGDVTGGLQNMLNTGFMSALETVVDLIETIFSGDWSGFCDTMKDLWGGTWESIKQGFCDSWQTIKDTAIKVWDAIKEPVYKCLNGILSGVESFVNFIIWGFELFVNGCVKVINKVIDALNWAFGWLGCDIGYVAEVSFAGVTLPRLASGGFVDEGQLFIANEAGPELVGSIGGQTAVANNDQIIEGIRQGVLDAMNESSVGGDWTIVIKDSRGKVTATEIISALDRKNNRDGKSIVNIG